MVTRRVPIPVVPYYEFLSEVDGNLVVPDPEKMLVQNGWNHIVKYLRFHAHDGLHTQYEQIKADLNGDVRGLNAVVAHARLISHFAPLFARDVYESTPWLPNSKLTVREKTSARFKEAIRSGGGDNTFPPDSADMAADIEWVYLHFSEEPVRRKCPDVGKFSLWVWANQNPQDFVKSMLPRLFAYQEQIRRDRADAEAREQARKAELEKAKNEEERAQAAMLDTDYRKSRDRIRAARVILQEIESSL